MAYFTTTQRAAGHAEIAIYRGFEVSPHIVCQPRFQAIPQSVKYSSELGAGSENAPNPHRIAFCTAVHYCLYGFISRKNLIFCNTSRFLTCSKQVAQRIFCGLLMQELATDSQTVSVIMQMLENQTRLTAFHHKVTKRDERLLSSLWNLARFALYPITFLPWPSWRENAH